MLLVIVFVIIVDMGSVVVSVIVVVVVVVVFDPYLPLKFGQNWVYNSWDIAVFVVVVIVFGCSRQLSLHTIFDPSTHSMRKGCDGDEEGEY